MKKLIIFIMSIFLVFTLVGCATILTSKAERDKNGNLKKVSKGIRVYPTRVYLIVKDYETEIKYLPDLSQAYDVKPLAFLSKNNFVMIVKEGQIKSCGATIDSSDAVKAMSEVVKNVELSKGVNGTSDNPESGSGDETPSTPPKPDDAGGATPDVVTIINGNLGLKPGIYMLDNSGNITQVITMEEIIPPVE